MMSVSIRPHLNKARDVLVSGHKAWKENSRWRKLPRRKKILIGMVLFLCFLVFLLHASIQRYNGYEILNCAKYVTFDMPEGNTVTKKQWLKIVRDAKVKEYPKAQYKREKEYIKRQYNKRIKEYGLTYSEYLKESDLTQEEFNKQIDSLAKRNVKEKLILHAISREKKIYVTSEEMKAAKEQIMNDRNVTSEAEYKEQTGESLSEHAKEIDLNSKLLYEKIVKSS